MYAVIGHELRTPASILKMQSSTLTAKLLTLTYRLRSQPQVART